MIERQLQGRDIAERGAEFASIAEREEKLILGHRSSQNLDKSVRTVVGTMASRGRSASANHSESV